MVVGLLGVIFDLKDHYKQNKKKLKLQWKCNSVGIPTRIFAFILELLVKLKNT
jgi:hypothetical protein